MASENTVKDSQPSLDLASATSGDKIVTAQVGEFMLYLIEALTTFCSWLVCCLLGLLSSGKIISLSLNLAFFCPFASSATA